ncbi:STAS domain-containing protein [Nocardia brasiliensis]|uniref:STAS domain-containing protein n=1 Tax=Nocardia brasiliensis TaxID=37326 RepID=UPI002457E60F|nr:STAS domain-containing protein [Nocardia brasiliensis]
MSTTLATSAFLLDNKARSATISKRGGAPSRVTAPHRPDPLDRLRVSLTAPSDTVTLCALAGEVDFYTAELFRSRLTDALGNAASTLVIDLSQVTFFGVAGLQVLLEARTWAEHIDRRIRLVTGPRCVNRLLAAAGDDADFDTTDNLADAVLAA